VREFFYLLIHTAILFLVATALVFAAASIQSSDPARVLAGPLADEAQVAELRAQLGLNKSAPQQYIAWLRGIIGGSWGWSAFYHRPALDVIAELLPVSLARILLALAAGGVCGWILAMVAFSGRPSYTVLGTAALAVPVFSPPAISLWLMSGWARLTPLTSPMWFEAATVLIASLPVTLLLSMTIGSRLHGAQRLSLTAQYLSYCRAPASYSRRILLRESLPSAVSAFANAVIPTLSAVTICEVVFSLRGFGAAFVKASQVGDVPLMVSALCVVLLILAIVRFVEQQISEKLFRRSGRVSR